MTAMPLETPGITPVTWDILTREDSSTLREKLATDLLATEEAEHRAR